MFSTTSDVLLSCRVEFAISLLCFQFAHTVVLAIVSLCILIRLTHLINNIVLSTISYGGISVGDVITVDARHSLARKALPRALDAIAQVFSSAVSGKNYHRWFRPFVFPPIYL